MTLPFAALCVPLLRSLRLIRSPDQVRFNFVVFAAPLLTQRAQSSRKAPQRNKRNYHVKCLRHLDL